MRFEDTITNQYSWGLTLDKLDIYSVDSKGTKKFVDRTLAENKNEPLRKLLYLSNFGIYWTPREKKFLW